MKRLMLLSNSTNFGMGYLDHAMESILALFRPVKRILFVPFALQDTVRYTERVRERFAREGVEVDGLMSQDGSGRSVPGDSALSSIGSAEGVFVGGGNTFRLLDCLQRGGYVEPLCSRVLQGMPYLGSSAGSVIAAPTLKTTNDMPIVQPPRFEALGLVPFQINAHYFDADPASRHMGETREERIREFLEENDTPVLGLREGSWLRVDGDEVRLEGSTGARVFRKGKPTAEIEPGSSLMRLLTGSVASQESD